VVKKRRKLEYEEPVTTAELTHLTSGRVGHRLRRRLERSGHVSTDPESQELVEQATGFIAEKCGLSIDEARDVLVQDAAARRLTMREAAERLLRHKDEAGCGNNR
jgi:AmiR/NasT family two-component response regulator